jgi:hypothetical protein
LEPTRTWASPAGPPDPTAHPTPEQPPQPDQAGFASSNRSGTRTLAAVLAIIGSLAIIAAILYASRAANSLSFMVGKVHIGHHHVRLAVSFVVGVIFLTGAWLVARRDRRKT